MSEHTSLVQRLTRVSGYYRRREGQLEYVHPYEAWRRIRPEDMGGSEWLSYLPDEESVRRMKEIFKGFRELVYKYQLPQQRKVLYDYLSQLFPSPKTGEPDDVHQSAGFTFGEDGDIFIPATANDIPYLLFYLAPLLPDDERRIMEQAIPALAVWADDMAMLSLYKAATPLITTPTEAKAVWRATDLLLDAFTELPFAFTSLSTIAFHGDVSPQQIRMAFRKVNNPEIQRHIDTLDMLDYHFLLSGMLQLEGERFVESVRKCSCGKSIMAACKAFDVLTFLAIQTNLESLGSPEEHTENWRRYLELCGSAAATFAQVCSTFTSMAMKRMSLSDRERAHLTVLASTLNKFAQRIEEEMSSAEAGEKSAPWWVVPRCLTQCLVESVCEYCGDKLDESSDSCRLLREIAMDIYGAVRDNFGWGVDISDIVEAFDVVHEIRQRGDEEDREAIFDIINNKVTDFYDSIERTIEEGRPEDVLKFTEAAMAHVISRRNRCPSVWRDYVQPCVESIAEGCRTLLEEIQHRPRPSTKKGKEDVTEEDVERAHVELTELFGGKSHEIRVELPPEYEDKMTTLAIGMTIALGCLQDAITKGTTAAQLPEGVTITTKGLQFRLTTAMGEVIKDRIARRTMSLGVDELVESALLKLFSPAVDDNLRRLLNDLERYRSILGAIAAVHKARKRGEQVPDKIMADYKKRFDLPITRELQATVTSEEELETALWEYAIKCFNAEGQLKRRREEVIRKFGDAFRAATGHDRVDYAYFIAHYAHKELISYLEIPPEEFEVPITYGQPEEREEEYRKRAIKAVYKRIREGLSLQPRPATVRIAWDFDAFRNLGHYGPDRNSCYEDGGIHEDDKYKLADSEGSFVATLHVAKGREKAEERGTERCVARLWGIYHRRGDTIDLFLTNCYDGGNATYNRGLRRGVVEAFSRRLNARVTSVTRRTSHPSVMRRVWLDGDGELYTLKINPEGSEPTAT